MLWKITSQKSMTEEEIAQKWLVLEKFLDQIDDTLSAICCCQKIIELLELIDFESLECLWQNTLDVLDADEGMIPMLKLLPDFVSKVIQRFELKGKRFIAEIVLPEMMDYLPFGSEYYAAVLLPVISETDIIKHQLEQLEGVIEGRNTVINRQISDVLIRLLAERDLIEEKDRMQRIVMTLLYDKAVEVRATVPRLIVTLVENMRNEIDRVGLIAKFVLLSSDPEAEVRLCAARLVGYLSKIVIPACRLITIIPVAKELLRDENEKVKIAMIECTGSLIETMGPGCDRELVDGYMNGMASTDDEVVYSVANAFPVVIESLGRERFGELESGVELLIHAENFWVRRIAAFGLKYYADRMHPEVLEQRLLEFLKDDPFVFIGIIKAYSQMVKLVKKKEQFLRFIQNPARYQVWRMRKYIAVQAQKCADLFDREQLISICKELLRDPILKIRKHAAESYSSLMEGKLDEPFIRSMMQSDQYRDRMTAMWILINMPLSDRTRELAKELSADLVADVRVQVAQFAKEKKTNDILQNMRDPAVRTIFM